LLLFVSSCKSIRCVLFFYPKTWWYSSFIKDDFIQL